MDENKFLIVSNNPMSNTHGRNEEWNLYQQVAKQYNISIKNMLISEDRMDSYYESILNTSDPSIIPTAAYILNKNSDNVLMIFKDMEYRGTKFLNPVSTIVADKLKLSVEAKHNNIPIPKTVPIVLPNLGALNKVAEYIIDSVGLPCVIKKTDWGLGIGIVKVNTYNELTDILGMLATMKLTNMYAINNFNYIAQEFIPDNIGSAVRVVVLNNKCIAAIFKKAPHWKSNSTSSGRITEEYPINSILENLSLKICKTFNINYAGLDFHIMNDGSYLLGEINTSPMIGFIGEKYPNLNIPQMILRYLMPHKFYEN